MEPETMSCGSQKRVAFVVQRCGIQINAGAERYVLRLAQALAEKGFSVDIYTSRAASYKTWSNELPEHEAILPASGRGNVRILRFPTVGNRRRLTFRVVKRISFLLNRNAPRIYAAVSRLLDRLFLWAQGPWCPELATSLSTEAKNYFAVIVKCYLYAPSVLALDALAGSDTPTLFIVTAHDEPEFRMNFVGDALKQAKFFGFVSQSEKKLCFDRWPAFSSKPAVLLPPGLDEDLFDGVVPEQWSGTAELPKAFCLVLGRIEPNKGIAALFDLIPKDCQVVLAGDKETSLRLDSRFCYVGRVSEEQKKWLLLNARALLVVSRFEAYSMVTAEAQAVGCPVLAVKGCGPVDELIGDFGGASVSREDFGQAVRRVLTDDDYRRELLPSHLQIRSKRTWASTAEQLVNFLEAKKGQSFV